MLSALNTLSGDTPDSTTDQPQPAATDTTQGPALPDQTQSVAPQQDIQGQGQAAPSGPQKPSLFRGILTGALVGMAGSAGSTSFGGGLGAGAQAQQQAVQQEKKNQLQQDANNRANEAQNNENALTLAKSANMQLNNRMLSAQLHAMDPHDPAFVQEQVGKLAEQGDAGLKAGALLKTPEFKSAAEAEQYIHANHIDAGNYQVRAVPFHNAKGDLVYGGLEYDSSPSTQDVAITYTGPDGKDTTVTVPAGTPKNKIAEFQVAAAVKNVDTKFKQTDQKIKADAAKAKAGAVDAKEISKAKSVMGYAEDENGQTVLTNKYVADQKGQPFQEMKAGDLNKDRQAMRQLNDVQLNTSRYTKAAQDYAENKLSSTQRASDSRAFDTLLNQAGWYDAKASVSAGGHIELPGISALSEALSRSQRSSAYSGLSTQGKALYDGFVRTMASIPAYQKALTGIGRSNKEMLELELANIANPTMAPSDIVSKQRQFQENIDRASEGFPKLPGIKAPSQTRSEIEGKPLDFDIPQPFAPTR